jgi:hypothetical protein
MDTSISWYNEHLDFEVINQIESVERGFRQANLQNDQMTLELIELKSALSAMSVIPNYSAKTKLQGFFKIGYSIDDFDRTISNLETGKVNFQGSVVTDPNTRKKTVIILDPDKNRIQLIEQ